MQESVDLIKNLDALTRVLWIVGGGVVLLTVRELIAFFKWITHRLNGKENGQEKNSRSEVALLKAVNTLNTKIADSSQATVREFGTINVQLNGLSTAVGFLKDASNDAKTLMKAYNEKLDLKFSVLDQHCAERLESCQVKFDHLK